jgi:plasmid stabilization system protein ParE
MRDLIIRPEAEADLTEAFDWYERKVTGLGSEFILAVNTVLDSILHHPQRFPLVRKNIRRALTRRFPYQVFFFEAESRIIVIAVFHAKRNPAIWRERTWRGVGSTLAKTRVFHAWWSETVSEEVGYRLQEMGQGELRKVGNNMAKKETTVSDMLVESIEDGYRFMGGERNLKTTTVEAPASEVTQAGLPQSERPWKCQ